MKLPIKQLKVYQSVTFEGAQNSFFTPSQYMSIRTAKNPLSLERTESGSVLVRSDKCLIEIFPANIAFIEYDLTAEKELAAEKKPKKVA